MNDIISTFNDLYYKIQISHNICLADVRNICLKSYNNSVVCDVDGGAPEIYYEILERDCGHFAVLKIERNSHEIIYESVNADFVAIALFLFLSRHQIKKTDNDIEIEEFIKKEIAHGNIDLARQVIAENFGEKTISDIGTIAEKLGFKMQDKTTLRQSSLIIDACEAFGYEIEPNVNVDQKPYKKNLKVMIYKSQFPIKLSPIDYHMAALFTDIGLKIALEDNELLPIEMSYIENYIKKEFTLSPSERLRLQMRTELIVHTKEINTNDTIKKLIKMLNDSSKETVSKFIISVAKVDGIIKDSELKILQKIFKQLGLSEDYLNSSLSELINNTEEVVIVEKGTGTKRKGSKIPTNIELNEKVELKLNAEKLEKIKINTSEIHSVLQEIFAEEQAEILKAEPIETANSEDMDKTKIENGLQNIVNIIIEKENWTRNELLNVIQNKGMMLSSTIDEINEWSNEEFGDFLVEEDDDVYLVNKDVVSLIKK